jgi:hypothetical protein
MHDKANPPDIGPETMKRRAQIAAFAALLEQLGGGFDIRDQAALPVPKAELLDAILIEMALETDSARTDWLASGAIFLCDFQPDVGPEPLDALGLGRRGLGAKGIVGMIGVLDFARRITFSAARKRYDELAPAVSGREVDHEEDVVRDHDGQHGTEAYGAKSLNERGGDRALNLPGQDFPQVWRCYDEGQAQQQDGRATNVDGHSHGLRNDATGVWSLFSDVTANFEAVVTEHTGAGRCEKGGEIAVPGVNARCIEND